jgi:hypothetical protein
LVKVARRIDADESGPSGNQYRFHDSAISQSC